MDVKRRADGIPTRALVVTLLNVAPEDSVLQLFKTMSMHVSYVKPTTPSSPSSQNPK